MWAALKGRLPAIAYEEYENMDSFKLLSQFALVLWMTFIQYP